jgi:hypothetical protein
VRSDWFSENVTLANGVTGESFIFKQVANSVTDCKREGLQRMSWGDLIYTQHNLSRE